MFPSVAAAPFHFTIEFACFVVAASAVVLVVFRPNLVTGGGWARAAAVLGFGALAVASVLHGASFVERDFSEALVALRAFGLVAVLLAVGATRAPPSVAAAFSFDSPLLFAPAGAGLLLAVVAGIKSRHRAQRDMLWLAAAGLLFAASEGLIAGLRRAGVVGEVTESVAWAAHGLRLSAYLAVGFWLWAGVRGSVRSRFVAAFAALLVIVVLALSTTLSIVVSDNVEREELARVETQLDNALRIIDEDERALSRFVRLIGDADAVRNAVALGRRLGPLADNFARSDTFPLDFLVFTNADGGLLAYSGRGPALREGGEVVLTSLERSDVVSLLGSPVLKDNIVEGNREIAVNVDRIDDDAVAIVAAAQVLDPNRAGRRAGIVLAGRYLDAFTVEEISAGLEPAEATLILDDRILASSLGDDGAQRGIGVPPEVRSTLSPGTGAMAQQQLISGKAYFSAFGLIESEAGFPTLVLSTPAEIVSDTRRDIIRSLFLVTLVIGAVALVLAWLSGRRISRPIQLLTSAAGAVREGDLSVTAPVSGRDEVGRLGEAFNEMTAALRNSTEELRRAAHEEEALRARIETIIQSMADGLVAVDSRRRILAFNMEAELLTGLKADEAIGREVEEILVVHDARGERASLPIYDLREGAVANVYVERRYGSPVPIAVTSAVLRDERDNVAGAVAVMRDMSREHEIDKMKNEFLSNISHELRTPLTPIKGYSELLTRSDLPPEKAAVFARGILDSTQRLERIVSLLVDYAAIESGRLAPRTSSVEIATLLEGLVQEWSGRSARHRFVTQVAGALPRITGDERLLRRSIEEVLDNAVKFSPEGGTITLGARLQRDSVTPGNGSGVVEVTVTDEGIGIPPEAAARIFSDFHQIDASETRTFGGLGLGLALVQRIVAAHHGEVRVSSEPEKGTRLTIAVPVAHRAPASEA